MEEAGAKLTRVAVSYALLARGLLGSVDGDEASMYHVKGLATDEVLLFVWECSGTAVNPRLEALAPQGLLKYYLEASGRVGYRGFVGVPVDSLAGMLLFLSGLAEMELRGDETAGNVRLRIYEDGFDGLLDALEGGDECMRLLAAALRSVYREDMEVLSS